MAGATELSPEKHPWIRSDILPHAIASAGWGMRYPGLCYELGEEPHERVVPHHVIRSTFLQERFAVVMWQPNRVTFIDISHLPERTFTPHKVPERCDADWVTIKRYCCAKFGAVFSSLDENIDPRLIIDDLYAVLATPIGFCPEEQGLVEAAQPITRLLIEYPEYPETREIPLDTTVAVLGGVATQKYLNTIYNLPEV